MSNVSVDKPLDRCKPEDLHVSNIDEKSIDIDWREAYGKDCEGWRVVMPNFTSYSRKLLLLYAEKNDIDLHEQFGVPDGESLKDVKTQDIADYLAEKWNDEGQEEPMMNYYYPCDLSGGRYGLDPGDAQFILSVNHLPLTVVEVRGPDGEDHPALALTGGGMDLSWEICEAYCRLGQIPPMHFWDLPDMCGYGVSKDHQWVMACIRYGAEWLKGRAQQRIEDIDKKIRWGKICKRRRTEGKRPHNAPGGYIAFGDWEAAWALKKSLGDSAWLYELPHARKTEFRTYFVCPTPGSIVALKKHRKNVELASGQCLCDSGHSDERPLRADCPECQGKGPKPKCEECLRPIDYGETICRYHKEVARREAAAGKEEETSAQS